MWELAAAAVGSIGAGVLGRSDAKEAQRRQEQNLWQSNEYLEQGRLAADAGYGRAESYMDQMLDASSTLENDLLAQIDPITAREVRRINQERQRMQSAVNQQMAARGMDSFTARMGAQANVQGQASNAMAELSARMAGVRSSAITQGRSAFIQGLGARAQFDVNRGMANADGRYRQAALYGSTQVVPPNTAQGIGGLIGGLGSIYRTSVLEDALDKAKPSGGPHPQ